MTRILHLSDPHFGTEQDQVLTALLALSHTLKPDLVLLGGDITQRARESQFSAARRFVRALKRPVLAVPGNHDIPLFNIFARIFRPYGAYQKAMGLALEPVWETDSLLVVGVNSTRPRRHERGEVDERQVAQVALRLKRANVDALRVVLLHHPVRASGKEDLHNLLIGREHAVPTWVEAGADLILGGHIHLPYVLPALAGSTHRAWVVQAGTALSKRIRGDVPNSVNVIDHEVRRGQHHCDVQRWDYDSKIRAFRCVRNDELMWERDVS